MFLISLFHVLPLMAATMVGAGVMLFMKSFWTSTLSSSPLVASQTA